MRGAFILIIGLVVMGEACAKDLGVFGQLYPITEPDLLKAIEARLRAMEKSGELERRRRESEARAKAQAARPKGIALPVATASRSWLHDPSVEVPYDITDAKGRLIYRAGTRANPLDVTSLTRTLLFLDGDEPEQKAWLVRTLKGHANAYVVILTNGPILDLMGELKSRLYFDYGGRYVDRFHITHLPATVRQEGSYLRVSEVPPEGRVKP